jgi:hypothetical protein
MAEVGCDISKFNLHAGNLKLSLAARGEVSTDLTTNLMTAYKTVKDHAFNSYIVKKEEQYDEGNEDLPPERLMHLAEQKYKILKQRGTWNAPTPEEEKIIALEAELKAVKKDLKSKKSTKKGPGKQQQNGKQQNKAWKTVPPPAGDLEKPKTVNGNTYYWCNNCKIWTSNPKHRTNTCEGKRLMKDKKPKKDNNSQDGKKAKLVNALNAVSGDNSDSDEE